MVFNRYFINSSKLKRSLWGIYDFDFEGSTFPWRRAETKKYQLWRQYSLSFLLLSHLASGLINYWIYNITLCNYTFKNKSFEHETNSIVLNKTSKKTRKFEETKHFVYGETISINKTTVQSNFNARSSTYGSKHVRFWGFFFAAFWLLLIKWKFKRI